MVAQALCELTEVLPTTDVDRRNGLNLCRRMWICRHDPEETNRQLAEKYVAYFLPSNHNSGVHCCSYCNSAPFNYNTEDNAPFNCCNSAPFNDSIRAQ